VVSTRHRTQAFLAAFAVFALVVLASLGWASWASWNAARHELRTLVKAVDERSSQVRAETVRLAAALPDTADCDQALLRKLVERSHYVRDMGRIRNNTIYCNAADGANANIDLGPPTLMRGSDNVRMWIRPMGSYAALGLSYLRLDTMSFVDMPVPPQTVLAVLDAESGHLLVHSDPIPKPLLASAAALRSGELRADGWLVEVSSSEDARTVDIAARPLSAIRADFIAKLPEHLAVGVVVGLLLAALVMAGFLRHYSLLSELKRALRMHKIDIALQPIVTASDGKARIVAFECLARWTRNDGTSVSPVVFVPMVEAAGLTASLARAVISSLLTHFADTLRANPEVHVSLNFCSADVSSPRLLDDLERMLAAAHIPASQIVIELTESNTLETPAMMTGLERLRRSGHWIGVDDFGTGTSNASRLAQFKPEIVKVDRSFLLAADSATHAAALLPQLVAMARSCGAKVVVEGVERPDQAALLAGYGVDVFGQGYYWHRPMSPSAATELLGTMDALA